MTDSPRRRVPSQPPANTHPSGRPQSQQVAADRVKVGELRGDGPAVSVHKTRWYQGYRHHGRPDALVSGLSRYLKNSRLTDTVCGLRMEKKARGEFYFFLTLETDYPGVLPDELATSLEDCHLLQLPAGGPYKLSEIERMVSGELKLQALGQCLTYRALRLDAGDDPFTGEIGQGEETPLGDAAEKLLWFLSSVGQGRWSAFQSVCSALGTGDSARRLARTLRLLGHLEFSPGGERWSVVPTQCVTVTEAGGQPLTFQLGARLPDMGGRREPQRSGPPRLVLAGGTAEEKNAVADPAEHLAPLLPDLTEYRQSLALVGGVSSVQHRFARFDGLNFRAVPLTGEDGLYEVTARTGRRMTLLHLGGEWRRGEWYGLRFLNLHAQGLLLAARYDAVTRQLALPADQRPPLLHERALVLCSGLLPRWRGGWLVYGNVSPLVAQQVTQKLGLPLQEATVAEESHE